MLYAAYAHVCVCVCVGCHCNTKSDGAWGHGSDDHKKKEHQFAASVQHQGHKRKSNKYESSEYLTSSLGQTNMSFSERGHVTMTKIIPGGCWTSSGLRWTELTSVMFFLFSPWKWISAFSAHPSRRYHENGEHHSFLKWEAHMCLWCLLRQNKYNTT